MSNNTSLSTVSSSQNTNSLSEVEAVEKIVKTWRRSCATRDTNVYILELGWQSWLQVNNEYDVLNNYPDTELTHLLECMYIASRWRSARAKKNLPKNTKIRERKTVRQPAKPTQLFYEEVINIYTIHIYVLDYYYIYSVFKIICSLFVELSIFLSVCVSDYMSLSHTLSLSLSHIYIYIYIYIRTHTLSLASNSFHAYNIYMIGYMARLPNIFSKSLNYLNIHLYQFQLIQVQLI